MNAKNDDSQERDAKRTRYPSMEEPLVSAIKHVAAYLGARNLGRVSGVSRALYKKCHETDVLCIVLCTEWPALERAPLAATNGCQWLFRHCASRLARRPNNETTTRSRRLNLSNLDNSVVLVSVYDETVTDHAILSQAFVGRQDLEECMTATGVLKLALPRPVALEQMKVQIRPNGALGLVHDEIHHLVFAVDIFCLTDQTTRGLVFKHEQGILDDFDKEDLISHNLMWLDENEFSDETMDWPTTDRPGRYTQFSRTLPLSNDLLNRFSRRFPHFRKIDASARLYLRMPFRSPRLLGMNASLAAFREIMDNDIEFPYLNFSAIQHVEDFWSGEESDPDLTAFYEHSRQELARLGGVAEPCLAAVEISVRIFISTQTGGKSFTGSELESPLKEEGITPRMVFESLL